MNAQWLYQIRIYLEDDLAEVARRDPGDPAIKPLAEIVRRHGATLKCQYDAFADYVALAEKLVQLKERYPTKTDAAILLEQDIAYNTIVQVMDTVRVSQEMDGLEGRIDRTDLFPDISIGDAPVLEEGA